MKNQTSQYGSCLIFNVGESRYRSKKTSVPGFFFAANGGMSVSDVIMPKERNAFFKIWRRNQHVDIRNSPSC